MSGWLQADLLGPFRPVSVTSLCPVQCRLLRDLDRKSLTLALFGGQKFTHKIYCASICLEKRYDSCCSFTSIQRYEYQWNIVGRSVPWAEILVCSAFGLTAGKQASRSSSHRDFYFNSHPRIQPICESLLHTQTDLAAPIIYTWSLIIRIIKMLIFDQILPHLAPFLLMVSQV